MTRELEAAAERLIFIAEYGLFPCEYRDWPLDLTHNGS